MASSKSDRSTGTGTASASNGDVQSNAPQTYAIDIRYFFVMLFTAMMVFFGIGILTAPSSPVMYNTLSSNGNGVKSSSSPVLPVPQRHAAKHSAEIGKKIAPGDLNERHVNFEQPSYEDLGTGSGAVQRVVSNKTAPSSMEEHLPAGQHLLVDIKNVEAAFLNSEERLSQAIVDTVKSAGLTLLSYHCHSLIPAGVSCVGVLLESHISFHTWPEEGVITLDLFTCGSNPLLPVVPELERLFGVPRKGEDGEDEEIETLWSHELRGFRHGSAQDGATKTNYLDSKSDLASWVIAPLDMYKKKQIVATTSEFYRIDVWDILDHEDKPTYDDALKHNLTKGDPRWMTPEIASPNRILFINGALKSMSHFEQEYFESLVHPAMFTHPKPVHVAIVGGAEGAAVREVLKHNTVESITTIELDALLLEIAHEYLPFMSDCSDIPGVAGNCFDDERVNLVIEDAKTWFLDRFGENPTKESSVAKFDIIIIDTLEPQNNKRMFNDEAFLKALVNSLGDDGVIAAGIGESHTIHDPKASVSSYKSRETFMEILENNQEIGAMFVYEESHTGHEKPNSFLTVCKNVKARDLWYAEALVIDYQISIRTKETKSLKPILTHFDGATQHLFQIPPRAWQEVYCRREPMPFECDYRGLDLSKEMFNMYIDDDDSSSFEIAYGEDDDGEQTTKIIAKVDIPKGSYIMPNDLAASFTIAEHTHNNLKENSQIKNTGDVSVINNFLDFIENHGHETISDGSTLRYVEVGASFMIRKSSNEEEGNVERWMPKYPSGKQPVYSPVYDRHMVSFDVFLVASKDIKKGEEIVKPENLWSM